jgi:hypothetical protein
MTSQQSNLEDCHLVTKIHPKYLYTYVALTPLVLISQHSYNMRELMHIKTYIQHVILVQMPMLVTRTAQARNTVLVLHILVYT